MAYPKFCIRCNKYFQPNGKHNKICQECCEKSKKIRLNKQNEKISSLKLQNTSNLLNKAS